jgi:hypothetical protein
MEEGRGGRKGERGRGREGGKHEGGFEPGSTNKECRGGHNVRWQMAGDGSDLGARAHAIVETGFVAEAELK